jgi:hypothetical protein
MISTKRLRSKASEHRLAQRKRGATMPPESSADWMKRCGAFVGFLATCVGVLGALLGQPSHWFEGPNTIIDPDKQLSIVNVDGEQFEFQLALTLMNKGQKPDEIGRPRVAFTSDKSIVNCSNEIVFIDKDRQGEATFPVFLIKESAAHLTCVIKWKPSADYYRWTSDETAEPLETRSPFLGRIALTWPGGNQRPIERSFALLDAETIRKMKPSVPRPVNYLDAPDGEDGLTHTATPSAFLFGLQDTAYRAVGVDMGGAAPIASTGMRTSPVQATKSHYAVQGEVAAGKEVSSPNPNEVIVNIRPCGGTADMVVFRAQFRKKSLGALPCGVQIVQVEKL